MRNLRILIIFLALLIPGSALAQDNKVFRVGIDASADFFLAPDHMAMPSFGLGARARVGRYDQWLNFVGGVRYIYGERLSGIQVPLLVNVNLLKGSRVSGYLGGGFEFDFIGRYLGALKIQTGLAGRHMDIRVFYKPYQGDLGAGFTYYF